MCDTLHANYFPPLERRRSIRDILPVTIEDLTKSSRRWATVVSWIAIAVILAGADRFHASWTGHSALEINHPDSEGPPLYQWSGYHRIAPEVPEGL